ncbi:unnamed protein product [Rotaria magnacalcarata]|uniref:GEVED domain-containing protein n=1 Tax=Rotaria magnacalcarata TaxID=392030 RepID=A0A819PUH3_9BILA|nr:unnamed protein product [Rotaria magnacalcarata]CAF4602672.1 unnamed protein product [Rotaria magnacalcarata]CAF4617042.1 unnamed protein product [Rotaria magnacalcarata]
MNATKIQPNDINDALPCLSTTVASVSTLTRVNFNDDGRFDDDTDCLAAMNRHRKDSQISQYTFNISIPKLDGRNELIEQYRMRIVLSQGERNLNPYGANGRSDVQDYAIDCDVS